MQLRRHTGEARPSQLSTRRRVLGTTVWAAGVLVLLVLLWLIFRPRVPFFASSFRFLSPGPEAVAEEWVRALAAEDGLRLGELTCEAAQDMLRSEAAVYSAVGVPAGQPLEPGQLRIGVDGLAYKVASNDGTAADVRVTGQMRTALSVTSEMREANFSMPMRFERGQWRYCGRTAQASLPMKQMGDLRSGVIDAEPGVPVAIWRTLATAVAGQMGQLDLPQVVAVDAQGNVYVTEWGKQYIRKISASPSRSSGKSDGTSGQAQSAASGQLPTPEQILAITQLNATPGDAGQIRFPTGVAVDGRGIVYVADRDSHRVAKIGPDGAILAQWGGQGSEPGRFNFPMSVAVDAQGNVYVADRENHRVQKLLPDGRSLDQWGGPGTGPLQFNRPMGVAVDGQGNLYVADSGNNRVQKLSPSGDLLAIWGSLGTGLAQFNAPMGLAVDREGNLYVADRDNQRVQKLSPAGRPLAQWGEAGSAPGQFNMPTGVAVDGQGNVYVADVANQRVEKLSPSGQPLARWGSLGSEPGQFNLPMGIAVDAQGNVYVADAGNRRIQKLSVATQP